MRGDRAHLLLGALCEVLSKRQVAVEDDLESLVTGWVQPAVVQRRA